MKPSRASFKNVVNATGLSSSAASYALRGHARIAPDTTERVRRIAAELGYRLDLRVASLMAHVRRVRNLLPRDDRICMEQGQSPRPSSLTLSPRLGGQRVAARRIP